MAQFLRKFFPKRVPKQDRNEMSKNLGDYVAKLKRERIETLKTTKEWQEFNRLSTELKESPEWLKKFQPAELQKSAKEMTSKVAATVSSANFTLPSRRSKTVPNATKPHDESLEVVNKALKARYPKSDKLERIVELKLNSPSLFSRLKAAMRKETIGLVGRFGRKRVSSEHGYEPPKQIGWMRRMAVKVTNTRTPTLPFPNSISSIAPDKKHKSRYARMLESAKKMPTAEPAELQKSAKEMTSKVAATVSSAKFTSPSRRSKTAPIATKPHDESLKSVNKLNARLDKLEQFVELKLNSPSIISRLKAVMRKETTGLVGKFGRKRVSSEYGNESPKQIGWMRRMAVKVTNIRTPALPTPNSISSIVSDEKHKSRYATMMESAKKMLTTPYKVMKQKVDSMKPKISEKRQSRLYKFVSTLQYAISFLYLIKFVRKPISLILVALFMVLASQLKSVSHS